MKIGFKGPSIFRGKGSLKILNLGDRRQRPMTTLTFGFHKSSFTNLFDYRHQLSSHRLQKFLFEIHSLSIFPYQNKRDKI